MATKAVDNTILISVVVSKGYKFLCLYKFKEKLRKY